MPIASYSRTADVSFAPGYRTLSFNPTGDVLGAEVNDYVSYNFRLSYNGGSRIDLGDVSV